MGSLNYKYDLERGHYYPLMEGEVPVDGQQNSQNQQQAQTEQPQAQVVNLESEDVQKLRQEKANRLKAIQDELKRKNDNIIQLQQQINSQAATEGVEQKTINDLQKSLIQAMKEFEDKKFEYAKINNEYENKIFQVQVKLVESRNSAIDSLPDKYKYLVESNIQNAKVHFSKLIEDDGRELIKGMVDFKKAFANSELLYGKDKEGFYAVCVDQEDINKLTNTLIEVGYMKDDILGVVLPQIFDRSNLMK